MEKHSLYLFPQRKEGRCDHATKMMLLPTRGPALAGRGTRLDISGCRFSLYPMDSDFISIILGALEKNGYLRGVKPVRRLIYRLPGKAALCGRRGAGLFVNAWRPDVHMALKGQFPRDALRQRRGFLEREGPAPNLPPW